MFLFFFCISACHSETKKKKKKVFLAAAVYPTDGLGRLSPFSFFFSTFLSFSRLFIPFSLSLLHSFTRYIPLRTHDVKREVRIGQPKSKRTHDLPLVKAVRAPRPRPERHVHKVRFVDKRRAVKRRCKSQTEMRAFHS